MGIPLVLLITYHFPPDNAIGGARPYRFYKYLKRIGYECHIITAAVQEAGASADIEYVSDPFETEPHGRIAWHIERIGRKFLWGTGLKLQWSASAFRAGRSFLKRRKNDKIVILSSAPPVATHLVGMGLSACSGRPWIADFRDPISSAFDGHFSLHNIVANGLTWLVMWRTDLALANTDAMHRSWCSRYPGLGSKTRTLWNGFDPEDTIGTYVLPMRERKILSHVGELYGGRSIRPVLQAALRLIENGRLDAKNILIRQIGLAEQGELPDADFLQTAQADGWLELREPVPAKEARSMALESDGLLLIQPQTAVQVPAKLFEYLRLGRPILAYVMRDSPAMHILQQAGVSFECIFPGDTPERIEKQLLNFIAMLDGQPVIYNQWFVDNFDASRQVETLDAMIRVLTG